MEKDRKYNEEAIPVDSGALTWWPTNIVGRRIIAETDSHHAIETKQITVALSSVLIVAVLLFQVGWTMTPAIVAFSLTATFSLVGVLIASIVNQSAAPLAAWIFGFSIVFPIVNYFAVACLPLRYTGGRYLCVAMIGVVGTAMAVNPKAAAVLAAVQCTFFLLIAVLEETAGPCYRMAPPSSSIVVDVLFQQLLPCGLLSAVLLQWGRSVQANARQRTLSDGFARKCIKAALAGDSLRLQVLVDEFDALNVAHPSLSDDAIGVLISVIVTNASSMLRSRGSLRVPTPTHLRASSSDDERSASPATSDHRRRLSVMTAAPSTPWLAPAVKGRVFIAVFALPHVETYAVLPSASMEILRTILAEFVDSCGTMCERYGGHFLFAGPSFIYAQFPTISQSSAASVGLLTLCEKNYRYHRDPLLLQTRCLLPVTLVVQSEMFFSTFGTSTTAPFGYIGARDTVTKVIAKFADLSTKPVALAGAGMRDAVADGFLVSETYNPTLISIDCARQLYPDGLPVAPPTAAMLMIDETYPLPSFDFEGARKSLMAGLLDNAEKSLSSRPQLNSSGSLLRMDSNPTPRPTPRMGSVSSSARPSSGARRKTVSDLPQEVMDCWRKFDIDGNGVLDHAEMVDVFEELGYHLSDSEIHDFFQDVDLDGNGVISLEEFASAFFSPSIGGAEMMKKVRNAGLMLSKTVANGDVVPYVLRAWQKYDKDGSNALELDELISVLRDLNLNMSRDEVGWLVTKLDHNGSGVIEFEEFVHLFADESTSKQLNAMMRIQSVSRVVNNKLNQKVFSTDDQNLREFKLKCKALVEKYFMIPLFAYIIYNCGRITLRVALGPTWPPESQAQIATDLCLDVMWLVYYLIKLFLLPRDARGVIIYKRKEVWWEYVTSAECIVDTLALLPLDFIYIGRGANAAGGVAAYFRVNKLLLFYYFEECYKLVTNRISPAFARASKAMAYFICLAHVLSCGLIGLARAIGEQTETLTILPLLKDHDTTYAQALYWSTTSLAGQFTSAVIPLQDTHVVFMIILLLVALPMYTVVLGTIAQAVSIDDAYERYLNKIDGLRSYFQYTGLPEEIENECVSYYRHLYTTTGSLDLDEKPLINLPAELAIQVTIEMGQETLRKVAIFRDACNNLEFVHELTTKLVPRVIPPQTVVMRKGERGTNMYFVTFGEFHVINDVSGAIVFTMRKGNFFGEIALLHKVKRTATIRSFQQYANVLVLDKKDFDEVMSTFPECLSQVYKAAEDRIKQVLALEEAEERKEKERLREEREKAALEVDADSLDESKRSQSTTSFKILSNSEKLKLGNKLMESSSRSLSKPQ